MKGINISLLFKRSFLQFRILIIIALNVGNGNSAFAQKKPINFEAIRNWPIIGVEKISNDGRFAAFCILSNNYSHINLTLRAIDNEWSKTIRTDNQEFYFTTDSRRVVYKNQGDTITIQTLGSDQYSVIPHAGEFKLFTGQGFDWLTYHQDDQLVVEDLSGGQKKYFTNVANFTIANDQILLVSNGNDPQVNANQLTLVSLRTGDKRVLGHVTDPAAFAMDAQSGQIAFFEFLHHGDISPVIRYYKPGMDTSRIIVSRATKGLEDMSLRTSTIKFDEGSGRLTFFIGSPRKPKVSSVDSGVTDQVWNYQDQFFATGRRTTLADERNENYEACFNLNSNQVLKLRSQNERVINPSHLQNLNVTYSVLLKTNTSAKEKRAKMGLPFSLAGSLHLQYADLFLVSRLDGTRINVQSGLMVMEPGFEFLLTKDQLIWFDSLKGQWFSFDIAKKTNTCITGHIPFPVANLADNNGSNKPLAAFGIPWFVRETGDLLIYDQYDIWKVDVCGIRRPLNLTNGYGRRHQTSLRLWGDLKTIDQKGLSVNDSLLLQSFSASTKQSGFFSARADRSSTPKLLVMGNDRFSTHAVGDPSGYPIKAQDAGVFLSSRFNAQTYPNLYCTRNFRQFLPLTDLAPQKDYNWYKTQLIRYRLPDGTVADGTLYKPEDFDPRKKYPVLFYYYEDSNNGVNGFLRPALSNGDINIPWFTSHGYLVFRPNIHYKLDQPGQSACDHVVCAANYLKKFAWVNSKKMGLQGYSFGGYETEYIVAHSKLFACAVAGAGMSNLISSVADNNFDLTNQPYYLNGQGRIARPYYLAPGAYIKNSPLFSVTNVVTPLLLLHGRDDHTVSFQQSVELFMALANLHKKAWLLAYDGERHGLGHVENQKDLTIKMTAFFDHFLKDKPMPDWLSKIKTPSVRN